MRGPRAVPAFVQGAKAGLAPPTWSRLAVGWIQFVSYLILNLNVMVVDVETGAPVARAFVDLRGSTDRSWRRATTYLLDNLLVDRLARHR